jgi:uncharacterized protein Yka (UPF0111/DUF47 family)
MVVKKGMIQEMGEEELLLPELITAALIANDRIKYYLALIQSAQQKADHPGIRFDSLREERELAQEEDNRFDAVVADAVKVGDDEYHIPMLETIIGSIRDRLDEMLQPLVALNDEASLDLRNRTDALLSILQVHHYNVPGHLLRSIASGDRKGPDSIHLLVMDLHRALNEMQSSISKEDIAGAKVFLLHGEDKELVAAFMAGLNRTAPLKFEHPGLGTIATRSGDRLVIQNDIGETESHMMIVHIIGRQVTIVQTDVHLPRVVFFQDLFDSWKVNWQDTLTHTRAGAQENLYHLSRGQYEADDEKELKQFLDFLGSRIVFLIDWNRARKLLQIFLPRRSAIAVLRWAADNDYGHRGFLQLGGDQLIFEALELAPRVLLRYGQPLYQVIGRDQAMEFFRSALQHSATGLLDCQSPRLIRDQIKASLLSYIRPDSQELIHLCIEHSALLFEVASTLQRSIRVPDAGTIGRKAERAKSWEKEADDIVSWMRTLARTLPPAVPFLDLIVSADDALDYLEEAMFLMTLTTSESETDRWFAELGSMTDLALAACQEFIKALYEVERFSGFKAHMDLSNFLHSVNNIIELEEDCDRAFRRAEKVILEVPSNVNSTVLYFELAKNIEESTNSLMKAAYDLKEQVFKSGKTVEGR